MRLASNLASVSGAAMVLAITLGGCGKIKQNQPSDPIKVKAEAKREQGACASAAAYDRLKGVLFEQAARAHAGDRSSLDTLADYSLARMEDPIVKGWDPALDIVRCKGHFVLEIPPGAERAFGGERRLEAELDYSAQAAADGTGFVYQAAGAEPIVARLAAFNLTSGSYRPPAAIDDGQAGPEEVEPTVLARAEQPAPATVPVPEPVAAQTQPRPVRRPQPAPPAQPPIAPAYPRAEVLEARRDMPRAHSGETGEATVRAFYQALGRGDGGLASAQMIPEKRSSRAYSPDAISAFYGRLAEPVRLSGITPLAGGAFRVSYRYSAGRSHCNGDAVVRVTRRGDRDLIRSIRALSGC